MTPSFLCISVPGNTSIVEVPRKGVLGAAECCRESEGVPQIPSSVPQEWGTKGG